MNEILRAKVKALHAEKGITYVHLAKVAEINYGTFRSWLSGKNISQKNVDKIIKNIFKGEI